MSGQSNVGNSQVYEAGDQRTVSNAELEQQKKEARFHEGKENAHNPLDSSKFPLHLLQHHLDNPILPHLDSNTELTTTTEDERTIANQFEREEKREKEPSPEPKEVTESKKDATLPVCSITH